MKLNSILNKRNYSYLYHYLKPYPRSVTDRKDRYKTISSISNLIEQLSLRNYKKIIVVASGPSSKKLKKEADAIYFSTNNAIHLVKDFPFIYMVNDSYYLIKYLKGFDVNSNLKGSLFWYYITNPIKASRSYQLLTYYLSNKKRPQPEVLMCNDTIDVASSNLHKEITTFLKKELKFDFYGVNSGFVTVVLGFVLAYHSGLELNIYGLDMGENGEGYYNKKHVSVGTSIKGDFSKTTVSDFFNLVYNQTKVNIHNYSYFKTKNDGTRI